MGREVTDPALLAELNTPPVPRRGREVTDPALLDALDRADGTRRVTGSLSPPAPAVVGTRPENSAFPQRTTSAIDALLMAGANAATLGYGNEAQVGAAGIAAKLKGEDPAEAAQREQDRLARMAREHPIASSLGRVLGVFGPGGLAESAAKKLIPDAAVRIGARAFPRLAPGVANVGRAAVAGGLLSGASGAAQAEQSGQPILPAAAEAAKTGATYAAPLAGGVNTIAAAARPLSEKLASVTYKPMLSGERVAEEMASRADVPGLVPKVALREGIIPWIPNPISPHSTIAARAEGAAAATGKRLGAYDKLLDEMGIYPSRGAAIGEAERIANEPTMSGAYESGAKDAVKRLKLMLPEPKLSFGGGAVPERGTVSMRRLGGATVPPSEGLGEATVLGPETRVPVPVTDGEAAPATALPDLPMSNVALRQAKRSLGQAAGYERGGAPTASEMSAAKGRQAIYTPLAREQIATAERGLDPEQLADYLRANEAHGVAAHIAKRAADAKLRSQVLLPFLGGMTAAGAGGYQDRDQGVGHVLTDPNRLLNFAGGAAATYLGRNVGPSLGARSLDLLGKSTGTLSAPVLAEFYRRYAAERAAAPVNE